MASGGKNDSRRISSAIARVRNRSIIDSPDFQLLPSRSTMPSCQLNYHLVLRYLEFLRNPDAFLGGQMGTAQYSAKEFAMAWKLLKLEEAQIEEYLTSIGMAEESIFDDDDDEDDFFDDESDIFKRPNLASYERFKKAKLNEGVRMTGH